MAEAVDPNIDPVDDNCASCGKPPKEGKALRCLHSLCAACIEPHLKEDGSILCPNCAIVTPSPGPGKSQLLSLPNVPAATSRSGGGPAEDVQQIACEECDDGEPAVSECLDCCQLLCDIHGKAHPRFKGTKGHRVQPMNWTNRTGVGTGLSKSTARKRRCAVHTGSEVKEYCMVCDVLLCHVCLSGNKTHAEHMEYLQLIPDAAKVVVSELRGRSRELHEANGAGILDKRLEEAKDDLQRAKTDAEAVSGAIADRFDKIESAVKERKKELLQEANTQFWRIATAIEERIDRLTREQARHMRINGLIESSNSDADALLMAKWIKSGLDDLKRDLSAEPQAVPLEKIVFNEPAIAALQRNMTTAGSVATSRNDVVPSPRRVDKCEAPAAPIPDHPNRFSTERRHPALQISNSNQTLTRVTGDPNQTATCEKVVDAGETSLRLYIRTGEFGKTPLLGVCHPQAYRWQHNWGRKPEWAWELYFHHYGTTAYTIRLTMDCDHGTMTAVDEETGDSKAVYDIKGPVCFFVRTCSNNQTLTIL